MTMFLLNITISMKSVLDKSSTNNALINAHQISACTVLR